MGRSNDARRLAGICLFLALGCEETAPEPTAQSAPPTAPFRYDPAWNGSQAPPPEEVVIETTAGVIRCHLEGERGARRRLAALAGGKARYRTRDGWTQRRAYDGATFDRAAAGRFIVARPLGGLPGPRTPRPPGPRHETAGLLSLGPDGELALTAAPAPALDASMQPIGRCEPIEGIEALTQVATRFGRPVDPPRIERLVVRP